MSAVPAYSVGSAVGLFRLIAGGLDCRIEMQIWISPFNALKVSFKGESVKNDLNAFTKRTRMDSKAPKNSGEGLRIPIICALCAAPAILSVVAFVVLR